MTTFLLLIWFHFLGDFILQTDKMALNKSKSNKWLGIHVLAYSVPFLWFGWRFALLNCVAHFAVDFGTSRLSGWAYGQGRRGLFFKIIGADQAIHMTFLIVTSRYL